MLIKHCFLIGKILFKQSNGLISVIWALLYQKQLLRGGMLNFKPSHTDTNDAECSGRPKSTVVAENTKSLHQLVLANPKLKLYEITEELKISEGSVFTILHEHLSMRKLCSQSIKNNTSTIQSIVCNCFNATKNKFLFNM